MTHHPDLSIPQLHVLRRVLSGEPTDLSMRRTVDALRAKGCLAKGVDRWVLTNLGRECLARDDQRSVRREQRKLQGGYHFPKAVADGMFDAVALVYTIASTPNTHWRPQAQAIVAKLRAAEPRVFAEPKDLLDKAAIDALADDLRNAGTMGGGP